jgi:hypothetical protein
MGKVERLKEVNKEIAKLKHDLFKKFKTQSTSWDNMKTDLKKGVKNFAKPAINGSYITNEARKSSLRKET